MICSGLTSFAICKALLFNITNFCGSTTDPMFCMKHSDTCVKEVIDRGINPDDRQRANLAYSVCTEEVLKELGISNM